MANIINLDNYDIDSDALSVVNLMQGILDRTVAIYASFGVPIPSRQYWTMGTPAIDCEQVVVSFIQMYLGPPGDEASRPQRCNMPRTAVVSITIARPIPIVGVGGKAPSSTKIQTGAEISAVDAWVLMSAINSFDQWDESGYGPGVIATLNTQEPQGGFQTVTLQLTMAVP
jgi:hypothetical protein